MEHFSLILALLFALSGLSQEVWAQSEEPEVMLGGVRKVETNGSRLAPSIRDFLMGISATGLGLITVPVVIFVSTTETATSISTFFSLNSLSQLNELRR